MIYRFDDLVLDPGTRRLLRAGLESRLSPKAFDLLQLLVANSSRAMSKIARHATMLLLAVYVHACSDEPAVRPNPPLGPTPTPATIVRVEVTGPRTVAPGETIQLRVIGHLADGSTVDLSGQASWRSYLAMSMSCSAGRIARARRRHRLEPDHLVLRAAVQLVARAGGRADRRRLLQGRARRSSSRASPRPRCSS